MSRKFSLRALLIMLSAVFALSSPALAQEAVGGAGSASRAGTVSTKQNLKFIPTPRPTTQDLAQRNRLFQGHVPQASLRPGATPKLNLQVGKPPKQGRAKPNLDFSEVLTGFHAYDGPSPYIPPDPTMAAGYSDLVVATNDGWGIYDKSGNQTFSVNFNTWFGDSADQFSDPHVVFDPWTGYYYMVVLEINNTNQTAAWVIDVSPSGTASGSHQFYFLNARLNGSNDVDTWMDYPYIGYSANAVYLTGSMISFQTGNFVYDKIRILKPSELDAHGSVSYYDIWNVQSNGSIDFDISPAQQLTNEGVEYLVNVQGGGGNYATIRRITNETDFVNGPQLSTEVVGVSQYNAPQPAIQPNGVTSLEAGDCRVGAATMQFGELNVIGSTNVDFGSGARDAAKIYRFLVDSGAPSTVDRDTTFGYSSLDIYYPAMTGTIDDDQLLTFDFSGTGTDPSIAIAGWKNTESGVDTALNVKGGEGDYFQDFGSGRNRWGDFSAICLDPGNFRNVWSTSEYSGTGSTGTNGLWSTWVSQYNTLPGGAVSVNAASGSVGETVTLSAGLTDNQSNAAITGENLDFQVDGVDLGNATTDGSGNAAISYTIPATGAGGHTIAVYYAGDSGHNPGSGSNTLTVSAASTALAVQNVTGKIGAAVTLSANLIRTTDNAPVAGETLTFYVSGVVAGTATTDTNGNATQAYTIPDTFFVSNRTIRVTFGGDSNYNSSVNTGTLTVSKADTALSVANVSGKAGTSVTLSATLTRSADGSVIGNRTLTFQVGSTTVGTATTNSSGVASKTYAIPGTLAAGSQTITVTFAADANENSSSGTGTLTVPKATTALTVANVSGTQGQVVTLSATLTVNGSTPLSGKSVAFTVNGSTVSGTTNGSGVATASYTIPASLSAGGHTISATFAGDSADTSSSGTGTLTVSAASSPYQVRYFPRVGKESRMVGGQFQGSANNSTWTTLYTVTQTPADAYTTAAISTDPASFRYLRYLAPNGSYGNVAEVEFDSHGTKLTGTGFGTAGSYNNDGFTFAKALDGSTSTYFDAPAPGNGDYVGIDTGAGSPTYTKLTGTNYGTPGSYNNDGLTFMNAFDGNLSSYFDAPAPGNGDTVGIDLGAGTQKVVTRLDFCPRSGYAGRMVGGVFQGSNGHGVFTTLYTVSSAPASGVLTRVVLSNSVVYRYVQYVAPSGAYGNVAEVEFDTSP